VFQYKNPNSLFKWIESASDQEIWEYLHTWHSIPETTDQLLEFIQYVSSKQQVVNPPFPCTDLSGTGGDGSNTFNISTAAAFVAASAGVKIAKHGARKTAGSSGSVDTLEALGINITSNSKSILKQLENVGIVFIASKMSAQLFLKIKKIVQQNKSSSFLSFIGPLTNPVPIEHQVLGVGLSQWMDRIAQIAIVLKKNHLLIVHGTYPGGGLDEISISGPTLMREIKCQNGKIMLDKSYEIKPSDFNIKEVSILHFKGGTPEENAKRIKTILSGAGNTEDENIVALNAAAAIYVSGQVTSLNEGFEQAKSILKTKNILNHLSRTESF